MERTMHGMLKWLRWKIAHLVYLLIAVFPITICLISMVALAISRRSSIILPIVMSTMLHPVVIVPIGVSTKIIENYLATKIFTNYLNKTALVILRRIFTYSLNVHLALIACLTNYLYHIWIGLEKTNNVFVYNELYNQCKCIILGNNGQQCLNKDTENFFQHLFNGVPIQPFLISFIVIAIGCHLLNSIVMCLPGPMKLLDFVLGRNNETSNKHVETVSTNQHNSRITKVLKTICILLSIAYFALVGTCHNYVFGTFLVKGNQMSKTSSLSVSMNTK